MIFVIQGEKDPVWGSMLWPQQWFLDYLPLGMNTVYINNKIVCCYNIQLSSELINPLNNSMQGMGTLCHEFSHSLGFPDLYHYSHDGLRPVSSWELMGTEGAIPQPHFSYAKQKYGGWTGSITTITPTATPATYTLAAINDSPFASYKIPSSQPNQFYVLEYRRQNAAYGSGFPGSGLIVYRVMQYYQYGAFQFSPEGNKDGPPDEIYVYRPYGTLDYDGLVDEANMSPAENRSSFYNYSDAVPWLCDLTGQVQLDGNLMLTDIVENSNGTLSFTVHGANLNVWRGDIDNDWNKAGNWSLGILPDANQWVEIPPTSHNYYPVVTADATAKHITVKGGAGLSVGLAELHIVENLDCYGLMATASPAAVYFVQGDLNFYAGSSTWFYWDGHIYVKGNVTFHEGSNIQMEGSLLEFYSTGNSSLIVKTPSVVHDLKSSKTFLYALIISNQSTAGLTVNGDLSVSEGSALTHTYSGTTILKGDLLVYGNGNCALNQGTLKLQGNATSHLNIANSSSYLNQLCIDKTGSNSVTLNSDLKVNGDLSLSGGVFNASTNTLKLGGNLLNSLSLSAFNPGVSTVQLFGANVQTLSAVHFYRLELNKSGGYWSVPSGSNVAADYYNWTAGTYKITGGSFSASFLDDPGIFGTIYLSSGSISYHQANTAFIDLRGSLNISGGMFSVSGGAGIVWFGYLDSASLTMSGGILDFTSQGILIPDSFSFTEIITGGTIRTVGSLIVQRSDFTPSGNGFELYGGADCQISLVSGSCLNNLIINKTPLRSEGGAFEDNSRQPDSALAERSNSVTCASALELNGYLRINNGSLDVNGQSLEIAGDLIVPANLKMSVPASINVGGNVNWNGTATVTTGAISCAGNWTFGPSCTANLRGCSVILCAPFSGTLLNDSQNAGFGNLSIFGLGENTLYQYASTARTSLKVTGSLEIFGDNSLALGANSCQAGSCYIHPQGTLSLIAGALLDVSGSLNLSGTLNVGAGYTASHGFLSFPASGSLLIQKGYFYNDAPWIQRGSFYLQGGISITNGTFEITGNNVYLFSHALRNFTNAYLKMGRSFKALEENAYHPTSGTLYLEGADTCELGITNGNYLNDLVINKDDPWSYVSQGYPTTVNGDLQLMNGYLDAGSYSHVIAGSASVSSTLYLGAGASLALGRDHSLNVNNGGFLYLSGDPAAPVLITRSGTSGYYGFNVLSGGTLAAAYCEFEYLGGNGVFLHPGASVDPYNAFKYCTFRAGQSGGTLLRIDNSQVFTIESASFPDNTWGGLSNLSKTVNSGEVTLINYSGGFAGAAFEQDGYNRINWLLNALPPVQSLSIFQSQDSGNLTLIWEYSSNCDHFEVYSSPTPEGNFILLGTTQSNSFVVPTASPHAFFRVRAVQP